MKTINTLIVAVFLISNGCIGQTNNKSKTDENGNQPKTNIKVNREYD